MKIVLVILAVLFTFASSFAMGPLSYSLRIDDEAGSTYRNLKFGVDPMATDGIDEELGENKLPEFVPPSDLYAVFFVKDSTTDSTFWSYLDYRPIGEEETFVRYYRFRIYNLGTPFTIYWPKFSNYIDSAYLEDTFTGNIIKVDMMAAQSHYVENFSQNQFNIVVYYNKTTIGILEEEETFAGGNVYPNPSSDYIKIGSINEDYNNYSIIDTRGMSLISGEMNDEALIDIKSLSSGLYFVRLSDYYGEFKMIRFIKN